MPDPIDDRDQLPELLTQVAKAARDYLERVDQLPAGGTVGRDEAAQRVAGDLPADGNGSVATVTRLLTDGMQAAVNSAGPRFFHFVTGGSTPSALAADWLTSALDNNAALWVSSPLGSKLEQVAIAWLKDLFSLPQSWGGVLTTGATMSNFTALAAARQWWGEEHGTNIAKRGMSGLPVVPVMASHFIHASAKKALSMLGIGHEVLQLLSSDATGVVDVTALEDTLVSLKGAPAIVIATAGEVNAGGFDPIAAMADLARRHHAWLHVDGAFGLFARVSPATADLADGVELADSVIADGHKWLNVPYDCGFAFVRDPELMHGTFRLTGAPYLPLGSDERPSFGDRGPEASRRARAIAVWATLRAYGRTGYRDMVDRHIALARRVGEQVEAAADLELLAPVRLNVICFRFRPPGYREADLDELNRRLGA